MDINAPGKNSEPGRRMLSIAIVFVLALTPILPAGLIFRSGTVDSVPTVPVTGGAVDNDIQTVTLQPNATVGKETYFGNGSGQTDNNYGARDLIFCGNDAPTEYHAVIQFIIPSYVNLLSATLSLYCNQQSGSPLNISVYGVEGAWEEGTGTTVGTNNMAANWTHRTTSDPWTTPGGDYNGAEVSYIEPPMFDSWVSWNVTQMVENWILGTWANNGFFLKSENLPAGMNFVSFYTSDYLTDPTLWPKLILTFDAEINPPVHNLLMNEDDPTVTVPLSGRGHGTVEHQFGTGTTGNRCPFSGAINDQAHMQQLYTPSQIGAEGKIVRISFNRSAGITETGSYNNFRISMAHTDLGALTTTYANNYNGFLTEVLPTQDIFVNSSNSDTWIHFDLNGNFTYDMSHNLLVDITWNGDDGNDVYIQREVVTGARVYDYAGGATGTIENRVPVTRFLIDVVDNAVNDDCDNWHSWPFSTAQPEMRVQMLYNKTLLNETGIIDILRFHPQSPTPIYGIFESLSIRLAHSHNDSLGPVFDAHNSGPWTEVFNRASHNVSTEGGQTWIEFDVVNSFNYNGIDNLLIDVRWSNNPAGTSVNLYTNDSVTYDCRARANSYNATLATNVDAVLYDLQCIFDTSANLTWSASSSEPWLFSAATVGNELRITPMANANGVGNATLTLTNSNGQSITQRIPVTVNPINDAPVLAGMPVGIMCTEDVDYVLNMSAYASDIDNTLDELTFSEDSAYATVNGMDIIFNYPEGVTAESVNITVHDPGGLTDTYMLNVTVSPVNDPPVLIGFVNNITCDATVPYDYVVTPGDEETPGDITISTDSAYATVLGNTITFLYPKDVGAETVTINVVDGLIYGTQNNVTYTLFVTIIDHPEVVTNSPIGTGVSLTTTVYVLFDVPMNRSTTEASFTLSTATRADVAGNFSWNTDSNEMIFTPNEYLAAGLYNVVIGTGATDWHGAAMLQPFTWNFTVDGSVDADGDGMPDQWEVEMGLDPLVNDAASDSDGDGMPNLYEFQNGLNAALNDADADADGDGATNFEEYEAGTDPNDPEDKPAGIPWLIIIIILVLVIVIIIAAIALSRRKPKRQEFQDEQRPPPPPAQAPPPAQPPMQQPPPQQPPQNP
jgi:hypothetical protein